MRLFITFLVATFLSIPVFSQDIAFELDYGFGTYAMKDLKKFNERILDALPVKGQVTDDFPVTAYWKAGILPYSNKTVSLGVTGVYNTTGSRISYKDYSGEYKFDQVLSAYGVGMIFRFILETGKLKFSGNTDVIYSFTKCEMKQIVLDSQQEVNFKSRSFQFEPGVRLSYDLAPFELAVKIGYLIDIKGSLYFEDDKDAYLTDPITRVKLDSDWSGFRAGISLCYIL